MDESGRHLPVLKQDDQSELVIKSNQPGIKRVQLIPDEVMKRRSCVLRRALNQPIQSEPLVNLAAERLVTHFRVCALGGGVGRVFGQSGLKGSGSGSGSGCDGDGTFDGCVVGSGSSRGVLGGTRGSVSGKGAIVDMLLHLCCCIRGGEPKREWNDFYSQLEIAILLRITPYRLYLFPSLIRTFDGQILAKNLEPLIVHAVVLFQMPHLESRSFGSGRGERKNANWPHKKPCTEKGFK